MTLAERRISLVLAALLAVGLLVLTVVQQRARVTVEALPEEWQGWLVGEAAAERVNINQADAATLEALPGIGPALAARVIAYREAHGPFQHLDGLRAVRGVGPSVLKQIEGLVIFE
jgi:competence ComEA-like helix-hairpin-helix protein